LVRAQERELIAESLYRNVKAFLFLSGNEISTSCCFIKKGDVIKCSKDTEHWHSSTAES